MPIPIKPIKNQEESNNIFVDYSFLTNQPVNKKIVEASNKDADIIMQIWASGEEVGENKYRVSSNISNTDIGRLKVNGFITSDGDVVSFTNRGKTIITTMALGENNSFIKDQKQVSYKEILANMSKKGKPGYRTPKFASDNSNNLDISDNLSEYDKYMKCTICGEIATEKCRCRLADTHCKNNHHWHLCPVHKTRVEGQSDHKNASKCTCK